MVSAGVYLNTLSNGFVYDDEFQILENPWIKDVRYIPEIFLSNVWAFRWGVASNYYRPLLHIIFMIDYHIFGFKPWGFHLINIIFHAGISALVFLIAFMLNHPTRREKKSTPPLLGEDKGEGKYSLLLPLIATILFAAHPIHTEVVAWVSGIPELSFTLFYLLSFYFYIKADDEYGKHFMLSILFFFLSTLCKETALTLPILLIAYDYSSSQSHDPSSAWVPRNLKSHMMRYLPYIIVAGIYFTLRTNAIGGFAPQKAHPELDNWQYFINIFPLFIQYLEKLILPINLNVFYVFHPISSIMEPKGIINIALALIFISFVYILRRNRIIFFSLLWIAIPILPVLYIPALGDNTFAERYLYLPSVGFVILSSMAIEKIYQMQIFKQATLPAIISILTIVTGLYSAGTIMRSAVWKDGYSLWIDTVKKSPDGAEIHNNLGIVYTNQGRLDEAIKAFTIALRLKPDYAKAHYNLGVAYSEKGLLEKTISHFEVVRKLEHNALEVYESMNMLGVTYYNKGLIDKAIEHYKVAVRLKPNFPEAHYNLGVAYYDKGWTDKAMEHYLIALKIRPGYAEAHYGLGNIYYNNGQLYEAIKEHTTALRLKPDYAEAHNNLGNVYYNQGLLDKAIKEYMIALRLKPDYTEALNNLGNIYYYQNRLEEAIQEYTKALKSKPDYTEAHYNLGLAYWNKGLEDMARKEFEIALKLRPSFIQAQQAIESLRREPKP